MKRNKLFYIIWLAIIVLSCDVNNVIKEEPRDFFSPDQFFQSDEEAIGAGTGVYRNLSQAPFFGPGANWEYWSHLGTDLARPSGGREELFPQHIYNLSAGSATQQFINLHTYWQGIYRSIGDANLVISRVADSENISDSVKDRVTGEAKFLRAYFYYWATNFWGDVPLWTDELDIDEVMELPRSPVEEVREQIVSDLRDAEQSLPSEYSGADLGRASRWAAKMLLCKVYLWQEDYQNARDTAEDIIENSPHRLLDNYEDIFGVDNEFNDENIWEVTFVRDQQHSFKSSIYRPRQVDEPEVPGYAFNGFGLITPAEEFVTSYDPDDERLPINSWSGEDGIELNLYYSLKFVDWDAPRANDGVNTLIFRLADAYLMFAEAENELNGPTNQAYARINAVRERAGVPGLSGLDQDQFRQAIMDERKWELAFEHHRRWDLIRWGELENAVQSLSATNPEGASNIESHHTLAPIPPSEISKNPNLTQNPGY